ncbi:MULTISPECIES: futalosine hydrolase [Kitasatospora]|uniref:Futalosine hydrolase n=1 Tax=Kitasatospora cathayae TaxID=3004092 RepID=A0ABY7Q475_9ACTN|nr:futalosine hydrolase [Kitasatospora sp. HUAS 3-15]WBP87458.1 futalosine hydrolase [Kitasatospora sp. HUAS 3-15]
MTAHVADAHPGQPGPERARLLVVVAVPAEAEAVLRGLAGEACAVTLPGGVLHRCAGAPVDVLAAGVGPAAAAAAAASALAAGYSRARLRGAPDPAPTVGGHCATSSVGGLALLPSGTGAPPGANPYGLVASAGIAGGFAPHAPVGTTVLADAIVAADLGAETPEGFADVTELGFGTVRHTPPPVAVALAAKALAAREVRAVTGPVLTVSTVTGSAERAAALAARHPGAAAEAMEGFGVAEAAVRYGVPAFELRTVSNPVGPRDRTAWRIGEALAALEKAFAALPVRELIEEAGRG